MLQILNSKKNELGININNKTFKDKNIDFVPRVNEWNNNVFCYNKQNMINIPIQYLYTNILFKSYFNSKTIGYKGRYTKRKWLSMKRIFISNSIIKYSINKVMITLNIYNKEKYIFLRNIQKLNYIFLNKNTLNKKTSTKYLNINYIFKYIKNRSLFAIRTFNNSLLKNKSSLSGLFNYINFYNVESFKIGKNILILNTIEKVLKKKLKKIFLFKYYISLLYLNNYKFNVVNILGIKNILEKIYNKNIILNFINLKYFYLNNDIFADVITRKLGDRKKRILKVIRKSIMSIKIFNVHPLFLIKWDKYIDELFSKTFVSDSKLIRIKFLENKLDILDNKNENYITTDKENIHNYINFIKNKHVIGIKLEGKGRLTKRLTASRSLLKTNYKGGLKNVCSSYQSLSSKINRNYINSNIQYINNNSKTRNGSFGLKSWINSY
jgi:hypothetical protein